MKKIVLLFCCLLALTAQAQTVTKTTHKKAVKTDAVTTGTVTIRKPDYICISVDNNKDQMTMTDFLNGVHHVVKDNGLYNIICREYWIKGEKTKTNATIYSTADAVVHQIDSPLMYEQLTPWRKQLNEKYGRPMEGTNSRRK